MKQERLYKIHVPVDYDDDQDEHGIDAEPWEPEGWREFAENHPRIPDDAEFFVPRKAFGLFRSRSAAKDKLGYFTRWGIKAEIVECTPRWESIPDANARRAKERSVR